MGKKSVYKGIEEFILFGGRLDHCQLREQNFRETVYLALHCQDIDAGLEDRLLFGTDYPIELHFNRQQRMEAYYKGVTRAMQSILTPLQWEKVAYRNFERIFV